MTQEAVGIIEAKALEIVDELEAELVDLKATGRAPQTTDRIVDSVLTIIGGSAPRGGPAMGQRNAGSSNQAEVVLYLTPFFDRGEISSAEIRDRWRDKVGTIPDALELTFVSDVFSAGDAINFRLAGRNEENLKIASTQLKEELARYPGAVSYTHLRAHET